MINIKKTQLALGILMVASLLLAWTYVSAKITLKKNNIEIRPSTIVEQVPAPSAWSFSSKISEARLLLKNIELKVGANDIPYMEKRISINEGQIKVSDKSLKDPEREIAMVIMDKISGALKVVKIIKRGGELIAPADYQIEVVERSNGIRWNYWATQYKVVHPANAMVLLNKWPEPENIKIKKPVTLKNGKKSFVYENKVNIKYITYAPYSEDYHTQEMIALGSQYIGDMVDQAYATLKSRGVLSRAYPDILVSDVSVLKKDYFIKIPITEHSDLGEFTLDPTRTSERVKIIIGVNGAGAYADNCNYAAACGWVQFTPRTYKELAKIYSNAGLIADFEEGAANHLNSMMAAVLLYDYNLAGLMKVHGNKIVDDPKLEEYLAAGYNGSPARVNTSLKAAIAGGFSDWLGKLLPETKGYLAKIRFLQKYD